MRSSSYHNFCHNVHHANLESRVCAVEMAVYSQKTETLMIRIINERRETADFRLQGEDSKVIVRAILEGALLNLEAKQVEA